MREVTINKAKLREVVQRNRDGHRAEYEEAMKGYKEAVQAWFFEQGERVAKGESFATMFNRPKPEDHTDDYDNVLEMLSMAEENVIKLTNQEFRQYVRDDWGWQAETKETFAGYMQR